MKISDFLAGPYWLKSVTHALFCMKIQGPRWFGLEFSANMSEMDSQIVRLIAVFGPPHCLEQIFACNQTACMAHENLYEMPFGWSEPYLSCFVEDFIV